MSNHQTLILEEMLHDFHVSCSPYVQILPEDNPIVEICEDAHYPPTRNNMTQPQPAPRIVPQPAPQPPRTVPQSAPQPPRTVPQSAPQPPRTVPQSAPQSAPRTVPQPAPRTLPQSAPQSTPQSVSQQGPIHGLFGRPSNPSSARATPPRRGGFRQALANFTGRLHLFFASLPPLWGVDAFLISVSVLGMALIFVNLSLILQTLAFVIYQLVDNALSIIFFVLGIAFLFRLLLSPRRWW